MNITYKTSIILAMRIFFCTVVIFISLILKNSNSNANETLFNKSEKAFKELHESTLNEDQSIRYNNIMKQKYIYVSFLEFVDKAANTLLMKTEAGELLNKIIMNLLTSEQKKNPDLKINEPGYSIKNIDENIYIFFKIIYDNSLTEKQKNTAIVKRIMNPKNIDILITGVYGENSNQIILRYFICYKNSNQYMEKTKILDKKILFNCFGSKSKSDRYECKQTRKLFSNFLNHIYFNNQSETIYYNNSQNFKTNQMIIQKKENRKIQKQKPIIEQIDENIYVTNISFMNSITGNSMFEDKISEFIDQAIINGINLAQKDNQLIKHNHINHYVENTTKNAKILVGIFFDPELIKSEKINKVINNMMVLAKVNILITGQYIDKGEFVDFRPLIISKNKKKMETKISTFKKKELYCPDPYESTKKTFCKEVSDTISNLTKQLLLESL